MTESEQVFDCNLHPAPERMSKTIDLIGNNFISPNLHINETKYAFLTAYEERGFFWLQPFRTRSRFAPIEYHEYMKTTNRYIRKSKEEAKELADLRVKDVCQPNCLAKFDDSKYYRAVVVECFDDNSYLVNFIDYGNYKLCSGKELYKPVTVEHFRVPLQSVCCRLHNLVPKKSDNWKLIDEYMRKFFIDHEKDFVEMIVRNVRQDSIIDCDVFLPESNPPRVADLRFYRRHIGQELVDSGLATFADPVAAFASRAALLKPEVKVDQAISHKSEFSNFTSDKSRKKSLD